MGIKSLAFFVWSPFTERDYQRFGIDELNSQFTVIVFDCTEWLAPSDIVARAIPIKLFAGYRSISSNKELVREMAVLGINDGWAAIDLLGACLGSYMVRQALKRAGCSRIEIDLGRMPTPRRSLMGWIGYLWFVRRRLPAAIMSRVYRQIVGRPDYVVIGGKVAESSVKDKAHKIIKAHSLDYELFLQNESRINQSVLIQEEKYIVFLDEDMVSHQDYAHLGVICPTTPERYFPALNQLFSSYESLLGMQVVIAAHPRSRYEKFGNPFMGRQVIKGKTPDLVRNSSLVFLHSSTSLSFAVLYSKPVLFLTSDDIDNGSQGLYIREISSCLKRPVINIDHIDLISFDLGYLFAADPNAYKEYIDNYLKVPGSPNLPLWRLVGESIAWSHV